MKLDGSLRCLVLLSSLALANCLFAAEEPPSLLFSFGQTELRGPGSLAVAGSGNLYVSEVLNRRIQAFTPSGDAVLQWMMLNPGDVAIDASDNVLVIDKTYRSINQFSLDGTKLPAEWGGRGTDDGQFSSPAALAVDDSGNVYVTDSEVDRVQKFDSAGNFLLKWGSRGTEDGQFWFAQGIALGFEGRVYVADSGNSRMQYFDGAGNYLGQWGEQGGNEGQFGAPGSVATDPAGNVYVTDTQAIRVHKFDKDGHFLTRWDLAGAYNAAGVVATDTRVYVSDVTGNQIYVYGTEIPAEDPALQITFHSGGSMQVSWSPASIGYALETATDPSAASWSPVTGGDTSPVLVPMQEPRSFYRLKRP